MFGAGRRTNPAAPPARVASWLLPVGVAVLIPIGTLAMVVRQGANLSDHRVNVPGIGWVLGGLVALSFVLAAVLLVLGLSSLDPEGRPPKARKGNWAARLICAALLAAGILYFMRRPPHQIDTTLNKVSTGAGPAPTAVRTIPGAVANPSGNGNGSTLATVVSTAAVVAILVVVAAAIVFGIVLAVRAIRYREVPMEVGPEQAGSLAAAVDAARVAAYAQDDPRSVIIGCYEAFEHALARTGVVRAATHTSSTVLAEAISTGVLTGPAGAAAADLVRLFERARFSLHATTVADVDQARTDLDLITQALPRGARPAAAPAGAG